MKGKTRAKQPLEIYSKMYYTLRVKHDNPLNSADMTIASIRGQIKKRFRTEP